MLQSCTACKLIIFIITKLRLSFTVDPEDLRKLSTTLSALATEKQKAAKVGLTWLLRRFVTLLLYRLLIKQRVKKVKVLQ